MRSVCVRWRTGCLAGRSRLGPAVEGPDELDLVDLPVTDEVRPAGEAVDGR